MFDNPFSLHSKKILITGASSGIGRATAIECSKLGAKLYLTARNEEKLKETISMLKGDGHSYIVSDLSDEMAINNLVEKITALDGCVHNAGMGKTLPIQFIKKVDLDSMFLLNTFAPILLTQKLVKNKKINKGGTIVFTSSISGLLASPGGSIYSATKGALNNFMRNAAVDLAPKSIRCNAVLPGMIETDFINRGTLTEEQFEKDRLKYPLKRYGKPTDVAYAIIYFLSDASSWVTGSSLIVDGGITVV